MIKANETFEKTEIVKQSRIDKQIKDILISIEQKILQAINFGDYNITYYFDKSIKCTSTVQCCIDLLKEYGYNCGQFTTHYGSTVDPDSIENYNCYFSVLISWNKK